MKNIVLILFVILTAACQQERNFKIIGHRLTNWLKWNNLFGSNTWKRGGVGRFYNDSKRAIYDWRLCRFIGNIGVLRAQPLRHDVSRSYWSYANPGLRVVNLGANSTAAGTALNDSLQRWKAFKIANDKQVYMLNREYSAADTIPAKTAIKAQIDSLMVTGNSFYFSFTQNNQTNVVGRFVKNMLGDSFQSEQTKDRE